MLHADVISTITDTNDGFFNLTGTTAATQTANCTFAESSSATPKPAICSWPGGITCTRIKVVESGCKSGIRSSFASCTTPGAGCTGKVFVQVFGESFVREIDVAKDPTIGTDPKACADEFPKSPDLPAREMVRVDQTCNPKQAWSADDTVLREVWRTDLALLNPDQPSFLSRGTWSTAVDAACNPADGLPSGSCEQLGVINITFPVSDAKACSAANWRCGQRANGEFGPLAKVCSADSSGQCTCTCPRCDELGTFVNVGFPPSGGTPGTGHYTVADLNAKETAACPVTIRGTTE